MQTLKIKYKTTSENAELINQYRKEFSNVLRYAYNRRIDSVSEKDAEHLCSLLNNVSLIKSYLTRCAVKNATQLIKQQKNDEHIIFGGKENFIKRCKGNISKDEFIKNRLSKLYIIGEANKCGNRMVRINGDFDSFIFKPNIKTRMVLEIDGRFKRYKQYLKKLYELQELNGASISYQLDDVFIYISFDEKVINETFRRKNKPIKNRIFGIDLNPNFVGWSVVDWKSSSDYTIIKTGVISIKDINDYDNSLKGLKLSSESKERKYINNKRAHEIYQISKLLVDTALHYRCETFCFEDLNMVSSDKEKGKRCNKLVNNQWNRNKLIGNIKKRCNIYDIDYQEVKPNYSSFVGNFLFKDGENPDMVLASIEIGRRGYEFKTQYITKEKEQKKNIIRPIINEFRDRYIKSLEEFNIEGDFKDLVDIYYFLKNSKRRYRVSFEEVGLTLEGSFSRCFSNKSKIKKILIT